MHEAAPEPGMPRCPAHLNAEAKAEWGRLAPALLDLGLLAKIDKAALAAYCVCWSRWVEAEGHVAEEGCTVLTKNGTPIQSPWLNIANKALKDLKGFLAEFGLSPAARGRVTAMPTNGGRSAKDRFFPEGIAPRRRA